MNLLLPGSSLGALALGGVKAKISLTPSFGWQQILSLLGQLICSRLKTNSQGQVWALGSESQACTLQKSEPKSKENDEIPSLAKMLLFHQGQPSSLAQGVDLIVLM